jgi:hypothetical protein
VILVEAGSVKEVEAEAVWIGAAAGDVKELQCLDFLNL